MRDDHEGGEESRAGSLEHRFVWILSCFLSWLFVSLSVSSSRMSVLCVCVGGWGRVVLALFRSASPALSISLALSRGSVNGY